MYRWLKLWDETQIWLKTLSHNTILKGRAAGMRTQMGKLETLVKNDELVEFMREFTSAGGLSRTRLERATTWIGRVLGDLDERLAAHRWLAGDAFSLADLAWSIDIHRFELIKFPMERFTAMRAWYRQIESGRVSSVWYSITKGSSGSRWKRQRSAPHSQPRCEAFTTALDVGFPEFLPRNESQQESE